MCDQTTNTTSQIKSGKVKAYAVTSKQRVPSLQKHLKAEIDKWRPLIKKAGVYAD